MSQQLLISPKLAFGGFFFVCVCELTPVHFFSHINASECALHLTWVTAPWAHPSVSSLHFSPSPWPLLWQPLPPRFHSAFFMDLAHRPWLLLVLQQRDTARVSPLRAAWLSGRDEVMLSCVLWKWHGWCKIPAQSPPHFALPSVWRMASVFPSQTGSSGIPGKEGIDSFSAVRKLLFVAAKT